MIGLALALMLVAGDAPASNPPPSPPPASTNTASASDADSQKMVCKTIEVTGTRFPTRECRTKQQWAEMQAAAREYVDKATSGACTGSICH